MTSFEKFVGSSILVVIIIALVWFFFVPRYNVPKFENIENFQTGFLIPLDEDPGQQAHFESADYLKDKKVAAKRVQIHRRWVQNGWMHTNGDYMDIERLIVVDRSPITREWTDNSTSGTSSKDESLSAQSKDGTGLKLNFNCTAFVPQVDDKHPEGAEHFLYYYRGESLAHVIDNEVRARVQSVAAEFTAQYSLETLRGQQHKLAEAVRDDVVPFFKERGIAITNIGLKGGFHYVNKDIEKSIDDAIQAQQLKMLAIAKQDQEKVQQQTKLNNQEIDNKRIKLQAEGEALALKAKLEGEAAAKLAAAKIDAETAKTEAEGKSAAIKLLADADGQKYKALSPYAELVLGLETLKMEGGWRKMWTGSVPTTIFNGSGNGVVPIFPFNALGKPEAEVKK